MLSHFSIALLSLIFAVSFASIQASYDDQVISDIQSGKRSLLGIGMGKTRFVVLIGNSLRESNPNNIYVYSSPLRSVALDSSPPTISLTNGGSLSAKFPSVYKALSGGGGTVRNRTVIISDSSSSYILFAFDSNGTQTPLLYNIDQDTMVPEFKGGSNMQRMLNEKYQVFTLISSVDKMRFYSFVKYYTQDHFVGPDPTGNPIKCIFEIDSFVFNGSSLAPKGAGVKLNRIYYDSSLCKESNPNKVSVSEKCKDTQCLDWEVMAGFADERRVYLVGRKEVHAVENVFASSNAKKKELTVQTFKFEEVFVAVNLTAPPPLPPSTMILVAVISALLFLAICCFTFWLCFRKNFLYDPGAIVMSGDASRPAAASSSRNKKSSSKQRRSSTRRAARPSAARSKKAASSRSNSSTRKKSKRKTSKKWSGSKNRNGSKTVKKRKTR